MRKIRAGFVGFGEINSPGELIIKKCQSARQALEERGLELVYTDPVRDDPEGKDEARAREELSRQDFDFLVICVAGWIPSHTVIDVISTFFHKPMLLWGLTGETENGRLVTTADQAGTSALRDPMEALGFQFKYVYDTPNAPYRAADKVKAFGEVARAVSLLKQARVGMMGYRDMKLHATLMDAISLRRVIGTEIEIFETLEIVQKMEGIPGEEISKVSDAILRDWRFDRPVKPEMLENGIRMYLAVMQKVNERSYQAVSLIDVDGVKKLLHFPPAMVLMLLADQGGVASIPENDGPGAVTQLMIRFLTGQVGAYFEFYEFMTDRVLVGVPDYVPSEVVDGHVQVMMAKFGGLSDGVLNVSKVKTGKVTLCRLASRGDHYRLHIIVGEAVPPRTWEEAGWTQPAPQLPSLEVILECPVEDFAQKVLGQHYILAYGDHRQNLTDLCKLLGIEVI